MSSDAAARPGPPPRRTSRPGRPVERPGQTTGAEQRHVEVLEAMVRRLSSQVEGLQEAMRQRAVIEQAKGVLRSQLGCTLEEAFTDLVRTSQHRNVKVARVAAELVAAAGALPGRSSSAAPCGPAGRDADHTTGQAAQRPPAAPARPVAAPVVAPGAAPCPDAETGEDETAWHAAYPLALAAVEAADSPAELAAAVRRFPALRPPDHVMVTALEPDGSLALVGSAGLEPRAASVWARIPAVVDLPMTVAARFGAPVWCADAEDMRARFPAVAHLVPLDPDGVATERTVSGLDLGAAPPAVAALPLRLDGLVRGVLGIGWVGGQRFPQPLREHLEALADAVARRLVELSTSPPWSPAGEVDPGAALSAVTIALQTVLDPALLLSPVRGRDGVVDDFRVEWANAAALAAAGTLRATYLGLTLREVTPAAVREHLLEPYRRVLATGLPAVLPAVPFVADTGDPRTGPTVTISVARLFDGLVVSWRAQR